jgi:thiosulfate dehydrogenase [quinone] large subunit
VLHDIGLLIVSNWAVFQWLLTLGELAVGLGLLLGFLSRLSAIVGLLLSLSTFLFTLGAESWMYDYLFEPALFLALLIAPPLPGLDSRMPWARTRIRGTTR